MRLPAYCGFPTPGLLSAQQRSPGRERTDSGGSMFRKMTSHVRAHFVGYLALFVALGGTSYAAVSLPKNSVTSKQVKDGSLLKKNFKNGQLPRGARGPQGPRGLAGVVGQNGLNGFKCADGHVVLTRARGQGAKATSGVTDSDFPMNNATFTQGADQVALFQGQFSWEAQSACSTGYILLPPTLF